MGMDNREGKMRHKYDMYVGLKRTDATGGLGQTGATQYRVSTSTRAVLVSGWGGIEEAPRYYCCVPCVFNPSRRESEF